MSSPSKISSPRPWTELEDMILKQCVVEKGSETQVDWSQVASAICGRTNKDCRKRWVYSLAPEIQKGRWDKEEDRLLQDAVKTYERKWPLVAQAVGSRNPDQCARRWHEVLKPEIDKGRWSLLEDDILKKAVLAHGRSWTEIIERYFPTRTPIAARKRFEQLHKKKDGRDYNTANSAEGRFYATGTY